jgi:hypothetical protein
MASGIRLVVADTDVSQGLEVGVVYASMCWGPSGSILRADSAGRLHIWQANSLAGVGPQTFTIVSDHGAVCASHIATVVAAKTRQTSPQLLGSLLFVPEGSSELWLASVACAPVVVMTLPTLFTLTLTLTLTLRPRFPLANAVFLRAFSSVRRQLPLHALPSTSQGAMRPWAAWMAASHVGTSPRHRLFPSFLPAFLTPILG